MINTRILTIALIAGVMSGCANMSGLDASSSFSCKAPEGVSCQSISGVHANASNGNLPFQKGTESGESKKKADANDVPKVSSYGASDVQSQKVSPRDMVAASSGMPVRQPPLVLRIWMAPFEDDSSDLHDQSYFYTMVHSGRWMIEANRSNIGNQYRPIYPLNRQGRTAEEPQQQDAQKLMQKNEYENLVEKPNIAQ